MGWKLFPPQLFFMAAQWDSSMNFPPSSFWQLSAASHTYATNTTPKVQRIFTSWGVVSKTQLLVYLLKVGRKLQHQRVQICVCVSMLTEDVQMDISIHRCTVDVIFLCMFLQSCVHTSPPRAVSCCLIVSSSCSLTSNCWLFLSRSVSRERILWNKHTCTLI